LILRGYHDFENGRLRFVGEGGNIIHVTEEEMAPAVDEMKVAEDTDEEIAEMNGQKNVKRTENLKKLFDGLKGKFMRFFEEVDDQEIE
jgi:hypothetical protein